MAIALRKGLTDFVPILKSIEVVRLTADNETCAAALQIDTFFGVIHFSSSSAARTRKLPRFASDS